MHQNVQVFGAVLGIKNILCLTGDHQCFGNHQTARHVFDLDSIQLIDGLRAIAVLAVVIFHLGVPGFDGGYIGVDVFFVISGFLITSIIKGKLEAGDFSLKDFYSRRIRRLVPPLLVTVAVTVVGAGLLLTPYDMIRFARSAVAAIFSLSNIVFFLEACYWDTASELKPLLHTWSLGVEEQFYLFWPALLVLIMAARERVSFTAAMIAITVIRSFFKKNNSERIFSCCRLSNGGGISKK